MDKSNDQLLVHFLLFSSMIFLGFLIVAKLIEKARSKYFIHHVIVPESESEESNSKVLFVTINERIKKISGNDNQEVILKFIQAGFVNVEYAHWFMPVKYTLFLLFEILIAFFVKFNQLENRSWMLMGVLALIITIIAPDSYLAIRSKRLIRRISDQMPFLIDLLAICVKTGMTIEQAMKYLEDEIKGFDMELSRLLARSNIRFRLIGYEKAFVEMYVQVPSPEMQSFIMTLTQSMRYGTSIYDSLVALSGDIREIKTLAIEEKIGALSAKMSIPLIVFILIPVIILITAPGIMRMMG